MAKAIFLSILRILMILICAGWISLWLLKPTNIWTRKWRAAEEQARSSVFGYYGLNFAVCTFPLIAVVIIGCVFLYLQSKEPRSRQGWSSKTALSNPLVVSSLVGVLSTVEILVVTLFILLLAWTFYARISNDFKKLVPDKSLDLDLWQLKYLRVATRFGLLAEACLAFLLLPILRGLSIFRLLGIQFETSVRYHIWLGTAMIFFAAFHGGSTLFIWGVNHHIQDKMWKWQKTGRIYLAGEITLVTGIVMWITSLPVIRRRKFEVFYYTHHLYIIFIVFFLFHAGDRHFYMVFPGIFLYGLDKLLRIIQSRPETCIVSARVFPSKVMEITLPKNPSLNYTPTSVIFVKIPSISKFQWHPFSITSCSRASDHTMSVLIKCEGGWTSSLYHAIQELDSEANHMKCIPVGIEGPYGPASADFLRHDSLLLVAGGIGISPFHSILREIAATHSDRGFKYSTSIQLIYVVKKSQDMYLLNSISSLLLNSPAEQWNLKLKVFVTQEQRASVTLGEVLHDLSQVKTVHFDTTGSNYAVHGLESLLWMAALAGLSSILFLVFLICFNHIFIRPERKHARVPSVKLAVPPSKKASKEKTPSWVTDLLIICSFVIAITGSSLLAIYLRWRRLKKENSTLLQKPSKGMESSSSEGRGTIEEHEIHFGGRPNFRDIFSDFANETGGSNVGVLACGPESMKESAASCCREMSQCLQTDAKKRKPYFNFHSLNFTL